MQRLYFFPAFPLSLILLVLLASCANQQQPDGGPPDTTAPEIVSVDPAPGTVRYHDTRVALGFSKFVDERTVEESIFISPYVGELEFDWSGREVEIRFGQPLREKTTYVVNVGTDVRDLKSPANRMAQAFSLAFSTGDSIDRGHIRGKVLPREFGMDASGLMIFAYRLDGTDPDTLNPHTTTADYISQSGENGNFKLDHIAFGSYRLIAVRDEYRNLFYDAETDQYALPSREISVSRSDTLIENIVLQLAVEDTTGPRLTKSEAVDARHVLVEFSEPVQSPAAVANRQSIVDTLSEKPLDILAFYERPDAKNSWIAETKYQDSSATYEFRADVVDMTGNSTLRSANRLRFKGSKIVDSLAVKLSSIALKDSAVNIDLAPAFSATFLNAVDGKSVQRAFHLTELNKGEVTTNAVRISDVQYSISSSAPLQSVTQYTLRYDGRVLQGLGGGHSRDSVKNFHFETLDAELLTSIEGVVKLHRANVTHAPVMVLAYNMGKRETPRLSTESDALGRFKFLKLDEGKYVLQAYIDANKNGAHDSGLPFPFSLSEPISDFSDTLKVRARWPLEGVVLNFR